VRALDWQGDRGFLVDDGGRRLLVATIAHYDVPQPHWRAFVRQEPVPGEWGTPAEAQAAADAVVD